MKTRILAAALAVFSVAGILGNRTAQAGYLNGSVYLEGTTSISTAAQATALITGTPAATFQTTLVNSGATYSGNDGSDLAHFLSAIPADAATASSNPGPLGSYVVGSTGSITVSQTGTYTFTTTMDDGGAFYLGGSKSNVFNGTIEAENDGQHGAATQTSTATLTAGQQYNLGFTYYNSSCCGFTNSGVDNSGGGTNDFGSITGPGIVSFSPQTVPEPSAIILAGLGAVGLLVAVRRRRKA